MKIINPLSFEERLKNLGSGNKGRLEELQIVSDNHYAFNFMRMEDISNTYKAKKDSPAEHVDISTGEYIARNTVAIYDASNGLMLIQSNKASFRESTIESYVNSFFPKKVCCILPLIEHVECVGENVKYKKIDVRFANLKEFNTSKGSAFENIVAGMNSIQGESAHIEIGMGYDRNNKLNGEQMQRMIYDLISNRGCVHSAKITMSDDKKSGVYDLFDNIAYDKVSCELNSNGGVAFETLAKLMDAKYAKDMIGTRLKSMIP